MTLVLHDLLPPYVIDELLANIRRYEVLGHSRRIKVIVGVQKSINRVVARRRALEQVRDAWDSIENVNDS
jgi:hypothetical protein